MITGLRSLAERVAREAGDLVAAGRRSGAIDVDTKSTATDVVTQWDRASERLIVERILAARPDDAIVGEEGSDTAGTSGVRWLIDPIDGTTNFLYDLPGWAVSIAALDESGTLAGAVYVPRLGELFSAGMGQGATLHDVHGTRLLRPSGLDQLSTALVATGFGYAADRRAAQAERVAGMIRHVRDIRRLGAAAVDLCHVAAGRVDAYFEEGLGAWDLAAGELIAREAGCRTGDFEGGPVRPAQALATTPGIFDAMSELVRSASPGAS